jgi:hypothetical protein
MEWSLNCGHSWHKHTHTNRINDDDNIVRSTEEKRSNHQPLQNKTCTKPEGILLILDRSWSSYFLSGCNFTSHFFSITLRGDEKYEGERELQMVQLSATRCSWITILWVSLVSFASITLCVASQRVFIVVVYFVIDSVRKLLDIPSYITLQITPGLVHSYSARQKMSRFRGTRKFITVFTKPCPWMLLCTRLI